MYLYDPHRKVYFLCDDLKRSAGLGQARAVRLDEHTWAVIHGGFNHTFTSAAKGKGLGMAVLRAIAEMIHEHVRSVPSHLKGAKGQRHLNALALYRISVLQKILPCESVHEQISQHILYGHSGDIRVDGDHLLYCAGCNYGPMSRLTPWLRIMPSYQMLASTGYALRRLPLPPPQAARAAHLITGQAPQIRKVMEQVRTPAHTNPVYIRQHLARAWHALDTVPSAASCLRGLVIIHESQPLVIKDVDVADDGTITITAIPTTMRHRSIGLHLALKGVRDSQKKGS